MKISKKSKIREMMEKNPKTIQVFQKYGMQCMGCSAAFLETVEEAAQVHNIDLNLLIEDLNKA